MNYKDLHTGKNTADAYFQIRNIAEVVQDGQAAEAQQKIGGAFLYSDTTTLIYSRTNYGKSLLAFQLAYAAATGTSLAPCLALHNDCPPMRVLVFDAELEARDLFNRHSKALSTIDPLFVENLIYMHERLDQQVVVGTDLIQRIENAAVEHESKLVIIDNMSKLLPDALKGQEANKVISMLHRIRKKTGASILVIGHTTKGNSRICIQPEDYYGSSMIQNFFTELSFLDITRDGRFFLCHHKTKFPENYSQTVPVFTRGEHEIVGTGFTFEGLFPLSDVQLPAAFTPASAPRKRNLAQYKKEISILDNAGIKRATIASMLNVDRTSIYRLFDF